MDLSAFFLKCANKKPCNLRYYRAFYYIVKKSFTCDTVLRTLLYGACFELFLISYLVIKSTNSFPISETLELNIPSVEHVA